MTTTTTISGLSKGLLVLAALCLAANIFLPIWKIDLFAPQYPEGLALLIYANKLGGDVEIINGLNHYIGMQTLHTENFIEFSILRYIFGFFTALILITALIGRKKMVYFTFAAFALFAIVAMVDFYRWNYNYGHNLDPNAAIKVPGMTYQPPLIGFKQLLNFGAYSMPTTGGILFIASGLLILLVILLERKVFAAFFKRKTAAMAMMTGYMLLIQSCGEPGPKPINLHTDVCAFCKMSISNPKFATQLTTTKGRHYVFDDIVCMVGYAQDNQDLPIGQYYVADFCDPSRFIPSTEITLIRSDSLRSPMAGNIAGFASPDSAQYYQTQYSAGAVSWASLIE